MNSAMTNSALESSISDAALLARMQRELAKREAENRLATYRPYTKQRAFHAAGAQYRERLLIAANQVGKRSRAAPRWRCT